ncbi:hypothetical protein SAMN05444920_104536 [Nonomuraea solani]|uniref:Uncharacterized protein n=1 Tax=Nonomuraea solani TaxID=1144553 RepID=A0A1H6CYL1_9ACTN|nr:hypothetical protein SAMN05444920_104536 [Nonomuraea solani]
MGVVRTMDMFSHPRYRGHLLRPENLHKVPGQPIPIHLTRTSGV